MGSAIPSPPLLGHEACYRVNLLLSSPGANVKPFLFRLDSVIPIIFGETLKLRSSSLCSCPQPAYQAQIFSLSPTSQAYRRDKKNKM
jgi:hypothetical protein